MNKIIFHKGCGKKQILWLQTFSFMAQGLVGIFFPFFVGEAMGWDAWQILVWASFEMLGMSLLIYPLNLFCSFFVSLKGRMGLGIGANMLFYAWLSIDLFEPIRIYGLSILFILFLALYWPNYHRYVLGLVRDSDRGKYGGMVQMIMIGVNIVAPLISGFLWEFGLERFILPVVILLFGFSLLMLLKLPTVHGNLSSSQKFVQIICSKILRGRFALGFFVDGIHTFTMWMFWPIYFGSVISSFAVMGIITSIGAMAEVVFSRFTGIWTDKISAGKMLRYGIWFRAMDLWVRGLYVFFPTVWMVGGGQLLGAFFGPLFQIPFNTRMYQIIESFKDHEFDFFVGREVVLGISRCIFGLFVAGIVYYFDSQFWWIIFFVAGFSVFGFWHWRK